MEFGIFFVLTRAFCHCEERSNLMLVITNTYISVVASFLSMTIGRKKKPLSKFKTLTKVSYSLEFGIFKYWNFQIIYLYLSFNPTFAKIIGTTFSILESFVFSCLAVSIYSKNSYCL
ncbi:hypothetical protein EV145_104354 [Flavobacterium sp. 245]|nr:hypothetical protein EV145_104354 [Flavobacterium sp. 245]